jgi:bifunctional non-homologous end joining protein LigD
MVSPPLHPRMSTDQRPVVPSISHRDLMLATPGKLFSAKGWIFELKHDGFRCLMTKLGDSVRLESRSGRNMSPCFPELVDELRPIRADFVADSELVVLDEQGRPIWERLTARHAIKNPARIRQAAGEDPAALFAFDLLWLNGADFRPRPLLERKAALYRTLPANRRIRYAAHFADSSTDLWELAVQLDLEGIVAKDAASVYSSGRSSRWLKIKTNVGAERERQRRPTR